VAKKRRECMSMVSLLFISQVAYEGEEVLQILRNKRGKAASGRREPMGLLTDVRLV
jgi:hypothetical protein